MQLCAPLFCFLSLLLPHTYTRTFFVFPPSPFIFALFPDCLGTRQVVARFGVLLTRGSLAAVSPFSAPVRSDPFTGWVPPNLLGAPSPFSVSCWVDRCSYTRFPFGFLLPCLSIGLLRYLFFRELVFSSFPTPFGSSFRSAVLAVPRFLSPFLGVYLLAQLSDLAHVSAKSKFQSFGRIRLGQSEAPCASRQ